MAQEGTEDQSHGDIFLLSMLVEPEVGAYSSKRIIFISDFIDMVASQLEKI